MLTTLRELQVEMIDRFGLLPEPVKNLFAVAGIKLAASAIGIRKLELGEKGGRILFQRAAQHRSAERDQADPDPGKSILT